MQGTIRGGRRRTWTGNRRTGGRDMNRFLLSSSMSIQEYNRDLYSIPTPWAFSPATWLIGPKFPAHAHMELATSFPFSVSLFFRFCRATTHVRILLSINHVVLIVIKVTIIFLGAKKDTSNKKNVDNFHGLATTISTEVNVRYFVNYECNNLALGSVHTTSFDWAMLI